MELLLKHETELCMSWHPGCFKKGKNRYVIGPIGSKVKPTPFLVITKDNVPKCLRFNIGLNSDSSNSIELAKELTTALVELSKNDDIEIKSLPKIVTDIKVDGIKEEYLEDSQQLEDLNKEILIRYDNLLNELEEIGCDCSDVGEPKLNPIPDEYYKKKTVTRIISRFEVCCDADTKFYQFLNENGFLEKYFPEWYKNGKY